MIKIRNLNACYSKDNLILKNINIDISKNTVIGIMAKSGAGKTTLINCLAGIHEYCIVESVTIADKTTTLTSDAFKIIRYIVHSETKGFTHWTFNDYIKFIHTTYQLPVNEEYVDRLIDGFSFTKYRKTPISKLSDANKKKCFLIVGLSMRLPLLILDEPFDRLDIDSSEFLTAQINDYKNYGSIILSSNCEKPLISICDTIGYLYASNLEFKKPQMLDHK